MENDERARFGGAVTHRSRRSNFLNPQILPSLTEDFDKRIVHS